MNQVSQRDFTICTNGHPMTSVIFCKHCAGNFPVHRNMGLVFHCSGAGCNTVDNLIFHNQHRASKVPVMTANFGDLYSKFIESVKMLNRRWFANQILRVNEPKVPTPEQINEIMATMLLASPPIYKSALRNSISQTPLTFRDFASLNYCEWIVTNHFWDNPTNPAFATTIETYVRELFEPNDEQGPIFPVDIDPAPSDLIAELQRCNIRVAELNRQKLLTDFFLQVTACFSNEDIQKNIKECAKIENQLGGGMAFLLRLGKLKALELHEDSSKQMKSILQDINPSLLSTRQKELYYYFSAIAEWQYVPDPQSAEQSQLYLDARNKKYYSLINAKSFIEFLSKAIDINKNPIYLAARGLGYMTLKNHERAAADFETANRMSYKSDAMDNNALLNTLRRGVEPREDVLTQEMQNRKTEYIMGLCKVLEKKKRYRELRRCCQEIVSREPKNLAFRVSLLRALLKLKDTDAARHELSQIKDLRQLPQNEVQQFQRKIELLKAYEQQQLGNLSDAQNKLQHAAKVGEPSSTYWFNYATFLFKHRDQRQNNEKALSAINRALEIRVKKEYFQLKYLLLFMMGNLEEASKIQQDMTDPKFEVMKRYVADSL